MLDHQLELNDSFREWPLHLTLVPWFELDGEHLPKFIKDLDLLAFKTHSLELNTAGALVASHDKRYLARVSPKEGVVGLHNNLLEALSKAEAQLDTSGFTGPSYEPHITVPNGKELPASEFTFDKLYLVAKDNFGMKFVVYILPLADNLGRRHHYPAHKASAVLRRLSHR